MFFVNFLLIACISALVAGDDYSWVPHSIPTASEQCRMAGDYVGICSLGVHPYNPQMCVHMVCAKPMGNGNYLGIARQAMTGTICGHYSVCKGNKCTRIPRNRFPEEEGIQRIYSCDCVSAAK